jgi:hypothetical protein
LARLCDSFEPFAVPGKNINAEFFLQLNNGLGHTWLRSMKRFRRLGEVQVSPNGFLDKSKLMQIHKVLMFRPWRASL